MSFTVNENKGVKNSTMHQMNLKFFSPWVLVSH